MAGIKIKEDAIKKRVSCRFDIRNIENACLIQGQPCKFKGKEDACPHLKKEKAKEPGTYGDMKFAWHRM